MYFVVLLSAIIFTNVSKVEMGKILNLFETHDIISTIWVDNRVLWVWPNIGPFRPYSCRYVIYEAKSVIFRFYWKIF